LFNCGTNESKNKVISLDQIEWKNFPPINFNGKKLEYSIVPKEHEVEYITMLEKIPFCIISKEEYTKLTGQISNKRYTIAIRALYTNIGGSFHVKKNWLNEVLVFYGILGAGTQVHKTVLLLELNCLPKKVYVAYSAVL
jgi:hypothetical protein